MIRDLERERLFVPVSLYRPGGTLAWVAPVVQIEGHERWACVVSAYEPGRRGAQRDPFAWSVQHLAESDVYPTAASSVGMRAEVGPVEVIAGVDVGYSGAIEPDLLAALILAEAFEIEMMIATRPSGRWASDREIGPCRVRTAPTCAVLTRFEGGGAVALPFAAVRRVAVSDRATVIPAWSQVDGRYVRADRQPSLL